MNFLAAPPLKSSDLVLSLRADIFSSPVFFVSLLKISDSLSFFLLPLAGFEEVFDFFIYSAFEAKLPTVIFDLIDSKFFKDFSYDFLLLLFCFDIF